MDAQSSAGERLEIDGLHAIGERIASAGPLSRVLHLVAEFVSSVVRCDSCFVYVLEGHDLVLRASRNAHAEVVDRLRLRLGQGITGWVGEHRQPVAIARNASLDPRFQSFQELPEDRYEAFLSVPILCRDKLVGVINVQHKEPHPHSDREIRLIATLGFLVGPEIELVRRETESAKLSELPEARRMVEAAQKIIARHRRTDEAAAGQILQKESRGRGRSMKDIAEAILTADAICGGSSVAEL